MGGRDAELYECWASSLAGRAYTRYPDSAGQLEQLTQATGENTSVILVATLIANIDVES